MRSSDWISVREASTILTENSGHNVSEAYVRKLGSTGILRTKQLDQRTKIYNRSDVERYRVKERVKKETV